MGLNANWLAAPIVIPLVCAALGLLVVTRPRPQQLLVHRVLAVTATSINLLVALLLLAVTAGSGHRLVLYVGMWQAPFGVTLVGDGLSAIMLTLTGLLMVSTVWYAMGTLDEREAMNFYPLLLFLLVGVNGAFLSGDLFNLYVFFEVLLMSSFVLLSLGGRPSQVNGGTRYVVLNLLASMIFLATAGVAYGTLGTLNLAQLADRMEMAPQSLRIVLAGMLLIAYGSKAGLFPLFFWLPASYHTPHPAVTAIFGGLLTKVGIYALFRIYPLLFPDLLAGWQPLILAIAGLTMLVGVFGAMAVDTIRRVLSFHVISQVGYMVMGLGLAVAGNEMAVGFGMAAGIFYIVHHMIVKTALLMAGGAAELAMGTGQLQPGHLGGLVKRYPMLAIVFFVAAFSLAGIPPSSGFISKLGLLQIALDARQWTIAAVSLVVSLLTLMSMVRLWQKGFAGPLEGPLGPATTCNPGGWLTVAPIGLLVAVSLAIGIFSAPFFQWSSVAAAQALDRSGYIQAVNPGDGIGMVETGAISGNE
ncbi:MAG: short chain dehydrogenase [Chloroflexi bacterium]|nr:MAG: short chain dehydrogenase [Chloroflexota bacterium]